MHNTTFVNNFTLSKNRNIMMVSGGLFLMKYIKNIWSITVFIWNMFIYNIKFHILI